MRKKLRWQPIRYAEIYRFEILTLCFEWTAWFLIYLLLFGGGPWIFPEDGERLIQYYREEKES